MADNSILSLTDLLPLTCSRSGTCCHGKRVNLNPWELFCFSSVKKMTPREFRDRFCVYGGIRLKFNGKSQWKGMSACSLYESGFGCSAHAGRPLVCRLYPLGRQILNENKQYIYEGNEFPCLEGCPEVVDQPHMTVGEYIEGQGAGDYEKAQDLYLEMMQNIADAAFMLLLESGLSESGDRETLKIWRKMGSEEPAQLRERIGSLWIDRLMLPELKGYESNYETFINRHYEVLISRAEETFNSISDLDGFREASVLMMGLALHLGRSLGAEPSDLAEKWIAVAKQNGAEE
ncbi:YkgJ family cysteine cluster protein [Spirochaeta isovalerica]|uniref:Fe-S-cluster containining protein n=1 Tax=Spirochaeta isovalerica TaxID=150 RepID=A0A841R4C4_9SPIO|nr:YkgJ family cysteine cluster protein [Spirochaeta isovalerica]MBB6479964.1 Fe-S-cluster containining protein [Spirochaeta isovalerica]